MKSATPPVLLTVASYYGTLAAARCFGRAGIPVTMADSRFMAPARWSRFVTRRERCPAVEEPENFIEWLLDFGRRSPGHVLYPTSDDAAWVLARHRDVLAEHFRMFSPPLRTIHALLDKRELFTICQELGIDAPATYFPRGTQDLDRIAREASFPLLLKPTTQVLMPSHHKGLMVPDAESLASRFESFRAFGRYHPWIIEHSPDIAVPMLQEFRPEAASGIYSVAGFMGASDTGGVLALAAMKVLQRPRKLGIGLCFEEVPLRADIAAALTAICRRIGYHGVFESEFIEANGRYLLIDFNPRFYSQMAFEIDRGLPLPLLAYEGALGGDAALAAARRTLRDRATTASTKRVYTHQFLLRLMTRVQQLSGRMSTAEATRWREWYRAHRGRVSDAVLDRDDRMPRLIDLANTVYAYGRHPRAFIRSMVLDR
jgi:predicted ATP-grasp superfamily ATP-dependent carboligase